MYWSTTSKFSECLNEAVPSTTKLPSTFKSLNVTLSVVSKPKSIVVTAPAPSVISISPCGIPVPEELAVKLEAESIGNNTTPV